MKYFQRKKSDKNTSTIFRVPNTKKGQRFLEQLRFFSTMGTRINVRGRGPRATYSHRHTGGRSNRAYDQRLPPELATTLAVYIHKGGYRAYPDHEMRDLHARASEAITLAYQQKQMETEITRLNHDRHELMQQRDAVRRQRDEYREQRDTANQQLNAAIVALEDIRSRPRGSTIVIHNLNVVMGHA